MYMVGPQGHCGLIEALPWPFLGGLSLHLNQPYSIMRDKLRMAI